MSNSIYGFVVCQRSGLVGPWKRPLLLPLWLKIHAAWGCHLPFINTIRAERRIKRSDKYKRGNNVTSV